MFWLFYVFWNFILRDMNFHFTCSDFLFYVFWFFVWRQWCPFYVCSQVRKRTKLFRFNVFLISFYVVFDVFKFGILRVFLEAIGCCCCHISWHMKWIFGSDYQITARIWTCVLSWKGKSLFVVVFFNACILIDVMC